MTIHKPNRFTRLKRWRIRAQRVVLALALALLLATPRPDHSRFGKIKAEIRPYRFNYVAWEIETLWQKFQQAFWGYHLYISPPQEKIIVLSYLNLIGEIIQLDREINAIYADSTIANPDQATQTLRQHYDQRREEQRTLQDIAEPIIERQVSYVLTTEGFGVLGQIVPPVAFRFVEPPDVLVISPRDVIRQDYSFSLRPLLPQERTKLEARVETVSPSDAAWITGVGGVGIWPAMVEESQYAAIVYEIVAHEWSHHYLFAFPIGYEYFARPETRIINETVATLFGNRIGIKVLETFYADEVARGEIWIPDYPSLADFYLSPPTTSENNPDLKQVESTARLEDIYQVRPRQTADYLMAVDKSAAAQYTLTAWEAARQARQIPLPASTDMPQETPHDTRINRTRLTTDYLLNFDYIAGAEAYMEAQRQLLGLRVLNQAWFAFNGGYQADIGQGGGVGFNTVDVTDAAYVGDPIGPATHEIFALAPTLKDALSLLTGVTTRPQLIEALIVARQRWNGGQSLRR